MSRFDEESDGDPHGECALEIHRLRAHLGNLLAVLHGDGGHYLDEHGMDKAVADALTRYYSNVMAADSKITALQEALAKSQCDAGRYLLIRSELSMEPGFTMQGKRVVMAWWPGIKINSSSNEDVDAAIDAALK